MTTPQQTPGGQREDTALAAGAAVGAVMAALQAALLALVAVSVVKVLAGAHRKTMARAVHLQAAALVNHAVTEVRTELVNVGAQVTAEAHQALEETAGRPVARTVQSVRAAQAAPPVRPGVEVQRPAEVRRPTVTQPAPPRFLPRAPEPERIPPRPVPLGVAPAEVHREPEVLRLPTPAHAARSVDRELANVADEIEKAGLNALRDTDDVFRTAAEKATANHATGTQAAQRMLDDLAERGITAFTDARGREWNLAAYCEMATRTAATRLSLLTQLQLMGPAGMDLVVVDNPSGMPGCRKCAPYEGRVLSLSGGHVVGELVSVVDAHGQRRTANVVASLADAVAAGLLHPNCRHYLLPFVAGAAALPLVGSERGFVTAGRPTFRVVPAEHDSAAYRAEQQQRVLERTVRDARARQSVALTPLARKQARTQATVARQKLTEHLAEHGLQRQTYREHPTKAR